MDNDLAAARTNHTHDLQQVAGAIWSEIQPLALVVLGHHDRVLHRMLDVLVGNSMPSGRGINVQDVHISYHETSPEQPHVPPQIGPERQSSGPRAWQRSSQ